MLATTMTAMRALLSADPGLTPADRARIVASLRNHGNTAVAVQRPAMETRILTRADVARRFNRTLRFVDHLAKAGTLRRVTLPGRKRACGFLAEEVERVMTGEGVEL
ncbi:MAG: hypothetical protein K8T26_08290 [Lentisphaerae bacterium]|nr:hypothetical protein [Lentisphaerota bacterium]